MPVYARAVEGTEKIVGWYDVAANNIGNQFKDAGEVFVEVAHQPRLGVDNYVDLITGEMRSDP